MLDKTKVLFVGEHPYMYTGNGNMINALLQDINTEEYQVSCFLVGDVDTRIIDPFEQFPFPVIPAHQSTTNDRWGVHKLLALLNTHKFDKVVFVGIDIFVYAQIFEHIKKIQKQENFDWIVLAPYDLPYLRDDHLTLMQYPDKVWVYSEYAYNLLQEDFPEVGYFRPPLMYADKFTRPTIEEKSEIRKKIFGPDKSSSTTLFSFVGVNQKRKNIPRMIKGFSELIKSGRVDAALYLHMNTSQGTYNIAQLVHDYGLQGFVYHSDASNKTLPTKLPFVYKCSDFYVNFSHHEGLSWTPIEAMLCGVPCLLSNSTAHKDFTESLFVPQNEMGFVDQWTQFGPALIETNACSNHDIYNTLIDAYDMHHSQAFKTHYDTLCDRAQDFAARWISETDSVQKLLSFTNAEIDEVGDVI